MKLVLFIPESPCNICQFWAKFTNDFGPNSPSDPPPNDLRSLVPPNLDHWHPPLSYQDCYALLLFFYFFTTKATEWGWVNVL